MVNEYADFKKEYSAKRGRFVLIALIVAIATIVTVIVSLSVAKYPIGFFEAYQILIDHFKGVELVEYADRFKHRVVWDMNLPRAIGGVVVGATLAVGGAVMQTIIKNPLADPYTTGIASGALFGVTIYLILGISIVPISGGDISMMLNAFIFAMIPTGAIVFISTFKKTSPTMMVLIGIGVMYLFSASTTMLKFTASHEDIAEIYTWSIGTIGKISWEELPILIAGMMVLLVTMLIINRSLDVLNSGDKTAISLGVNPIRLRVLCLIIISVSTAIAVCFTGTIGFVGLVAPHIARMFVGSNARYLIPTSALFGAFMLLAADCIARSAGTTGLPVGVITALIGSPLFLYFLIKQKKSAW